MVDGAKSISMDIGLAGGWLTFGLPHLRRSHVAQHGDILEVTVFACPAVAQ